MTDLRKKRFWAMRTDRDNCALILDEVRRGRLRQGWGTSPEQDLRFLARKQQAGQTWDVHDSEAWRNWPMMGGDRGMNQGDWLLLPNLPSGGTFMLVEISGPYDYQPVELDDKTDINGLGQDYGHLLPIRILGKVEEGEFPWMSMQDERLEAGLRRSLTCRSRLWSLDAFGENLQDIKQALDGGNGHCLKWDLHGSFYRSVETARKDVEEKMQAKLEAEFRDHFTRSDLEVPCQILLEALYPAADIERVAGPGEHGADLIVTFEDPLVRSGFPSDIGWRAVFQVKDWRGEAADTHALDQLAQAVREYAKEGLPVRGAFVLCFCDRESEGFRLRRDELSKKLDIPVGFVGKRHLLRLFGDMALGRKIG